MRLEEVLPELMGSLTLSELLFRGEGPPRAWNRMDQYHRKMRKPVGSKAHAPSVARPQLALGPLSESLCAKGPATHSWPWSHSG